jgi:hypothetical protein
MGIRRRKWFLVLCLLTVVTAFSWFGARMVFAEDSSSIPTSTTTQTTIAEPSPVTPSDAAEATTVPDNGGAVSTTVSPAQLDQIKDLILKLGNNLLIVFILISVCIVINVLSFFYLIRLIGKTKSVLRKDIVMINKDQHPK